MYSTKSVGPRIEPWETPALTGYSYKTCYPGPSKAVYYCEKSK